MPAFIKKRFHSFQHKLFQTFFFLLGILFLSSLNPSVTEARRNSDSASREDLLKQTTNQGYQSNSTSSFLDRVNSIFNQKAEPVRAYVDQTQQTNQPETPLSPSPFETTTPTASGRNPYGAEDANAPINTRVKSESEFAKPMDQQIRMDDARFQEMMESRYQKTLEEELETQRNQKTFSHKLAQQREENVPNKKSGMRASLANNPFYFGEQNNVNSFEDNKSLMLSRLIQNGYTRLEAENILLGATSPEEAILTLMKNEGMEYGQALDIVGSSNITLPDEDSMEY